MKIYLAVAVKVQRLYWEIKNHFVRAVKVQYIITEETLHLLQNGTANWWNFFVNWSSYIKVEVKTMLLLFLLLILQFLLQLTWKISQNAWMGKIWVFHLFSMNWEKIFTDIGKSMETSFPYLGIVWVFKFDRVLFKAHSMGIY